MTGTAAEPHLKGGKMTGAISLLFRAPALQDEGSVCMCEWSVRKGHAGRERHAALTQKKRTERQWGAEGFNKSVLH